MSANNPPPAPTEGFLVIGYLKKLVSWMKKNRPIAGPGILAKQTEGGIVFSTAPSSTTPTPWQTTRNDDGETKRVLVHPGTINSLVPTNIFSPLTISGSGTEYVVLTMTVTGDDPVSCVLSIETSYPVPSSTTPSAPPTAVKDVIAVIYGGTVYQIRSVNLTATSVEVFQETVASPSPGERNYIPWYRWEVGES